MMCGDFNEIMDQSEKRGGRFVMMEVFVSLEQ